MMLVFIAGTESRHDNDSNVKRRRKQESVKAKKAKNTKRKQDEPWEVY